MPFVGAGWRLRGGRVLNERLIRGIGLRTD